MNQLKVFKNLEFGQVRTMEVNGEPMFCLTDVCKALELTNSRSVAERLEDDERCKLDLPRQGETWFITESGLYAVILRSDKPNAKKFRKWITSEVIPSIRKTGTYSATTLPPQFQLMQGLLDQMAEQEQRLQGVETFCSNVKEVMAAPIGDWREEMNSHVRKIAKSSGIDYRALYTELYIELEKRAKCDLTKLSVNKQNRLTSQGKTKSYIDSECKKIAVISDNVRLKEIFQSIIKEYLIKYCA